MIAVTGIYECIGRYFRITCFARLPKTFADAGYDEVTAGMYAMWIVAGMCLITATVVGFLV